VSESEREREINSCLFCVVVNLVDKEGNGVLHFLVRSEFQTADNVKKKKHKHKKTNVTNQTNKQTQT